MKTLTPQEALLQGADWWTKAAETLEELVLRVLPVEEHAQYMVLVASYRERAEFNRRIAEGKPIAS
jgi:hypothetical protein